VENGKHMPNTMENGIVKFDQNKNKNKCVFFKIIISKLIIEL
jgi:hypothetical protein